LPSAAGILYNYRMEQTSFIRPAITLFELNSLVREAISRELPDLYWVTAEIAELKLNQKGHCYLDLVEKEDHKTVAQIRATIWAYEYRTLSRKFETAAKTPLKSGIKALLLVAVGFHEVYGLSLNIKDIDPAYTVGEMALRKREIIERLRREGLLDRNKDIPLPLVPQRIAVISSPTAAGYGDFTEHLERNPYNYKFQHTIFSAVMQGEDAEKSVLAAFDAIEKQKGSFDVVVLIRGGGSVADLGCFDNYAMAARIAHCGLPVITGIGHEKDDTVADMAAHTKMKTPTAVAEFLISGVRSFDERINSTGSSICLAAERLLNLSSNALEMISRRFAHAASNAAAAPLVRIDTLKKNIGVQLKRLLEKKESRLATCEQALRHLDPVNVLRRGYSITRFKGRSVKDSSILPIGAIIMSEFYQGRVSSSVVGQEEDDGKIKGT
jgi:exodeoxyribonuclease VII large subunit